MFSNIHYQYHYNYQPDKPKKHRCNFIPLNRNVKTCRKLCNSDQDYCPYHQKVIEKRYQNDVVPMEVD